MNRKVILVILDGLGWQSARSLLGNIEGWVDTEQANVWKMKSVLPSTSGPCYVSIHTGLQPQTHGIHTNRQQQRVTHPDIFSALSAAGCRTAAVAHSHFSVYFQDAPFEPLRDEPDYILVHSSSPDSVGHAYGAASIQMDSNAYEIDAALSHFLPVWLNDGYEVMITADHGQSARGHHGIKNNGCCDS